MLCILSHQQSTTMPSLIVKPISVLRNTKGPNLPLHIKGIKRPLKPTCSAFHILPNELLYLIFEKLSNKDLLKLRSTNKLNQSIANKILKSRLEKSVKSLTENLSALNTTYKQMYEERKPELRHFRGFLRNLPSSHLTEMTWYNTAPQEIQTVCQCLAILKNGPNQTDTGDVWNDVKKQMSKYDFKSWFLDLKKNVESIDIANIQIVQNIIAHDPTITYERLRSLSTSGYHLLIVIAACLQFGTIAQDLKIKKSIINSEQFRLNRNIQLLNAVRKNKL